VHEAPDGEDGHGAEGQHPERGRVGRDAVEPEGAAERLAVLEDHADDLAEAERDDGEVVALQPERGQPDEQAGEGRAQPAGAEGAEEKEVLRPRRPAVRAEEPGAEQHGHGGGQVGADRHEARVAEGELAGVAVHQVQADGEDDVDADADRDVEVVGVEPAGERREAGGGGEGGEQGEEGARHVRPSPW
jgi:hypothetical protein